MGMNFSPRILKRLLEADPGGEGTAQANPTPSRKLRQLRKGSGTHAPSRTRSEPATRKRRGRPGRPAPRTGAHAPVRAPAAVNRPTRARSAPARPAGRERARPVRAAEPRLGAPPPHLLPRAPAEQREWAARGASQAECESLTLANQNEPSLEEGKTPPPHRSTRRVLQIQPA